MKTLMDEIRFQQGRDMNAHLSMISLRFAFHFRHTAPRALPKLERECAGPRITFNFAGSNFVRCSTLRQLCTSTECTRIE